MQESFNKSGALLGAVPTILLFIGGPGLPVFDARAADAILKERRAAPWAPLKTRTGPLRRLRPGG